MILIPTLHFYAQLLKRFGGIDLSLFELAHEVSDEWSFFIHRSSSIHLAKGGVELGHHVWRLWLFETSEIVHM